MVDTIKNGTRVDGYIIEKCISTHGGMAAVYLARIEKNNRRVVMKIAFTDELAVTHEDVLLQREAEFLQRGELRHPGIVRIFPVSLKNRRPQYVVRASSLSGGPRYIVIEYLRGGTLEDNLKEISKYPLDWKLELFYQILLPISFLHSKGYAHRDIKPLNIMFRTPISPNKFPEPVFIDFALASKGEENSPIVTDSYTLGYASPERIINTMQSTDGKVTWEGAQAADIWSTGVVLYEILTGQFLFRGNREGIKKKITLEQIAPELLISGERGEILAAFIRGMLSKDAEKRPSVNTIIAALEHNLLPPYLDV